MQKNSYITWIVVVVIVAVALFLVFKNKKQVVTPAPVTDSTTQTTPEPTDSVQDTTDVTTGPGAVSISYANALIKYKDRRLQFDTSCQATPRSVTYKDNTGIMLDNRSAQTRTIKVGTTYTIKPYGFKIVVLPDIYLKSKTLLVDCGTAQNVATILIQE